MNAAKFICVIGDVVGSRNLKGEKERSELQTKLEKCLRQINQKKEGLVSPYTITLGDEFQVVLNDANRLFADCWLVEHAVFPIKVRFSIGTGHLSTRINTEQALGMDGAAFHAARLGVNELRKEGGLFKWTSYPVPPSSWVNSVLDLISHDSDHWKDKRLLVLHELLTGKSNVQQIAQKIGMSKIGAYKNIRAGALKTIAALLNEISGLINKRIGNDYGATLSLPDKHSLANADLAELQ